MAVDLDQITRDIRQVARSIERRWERDAAPAGIRADADTIRRTVDERALSRVVAFILESHERDRGYIAAQRLEAVLQQLTINHRAAVASSLSQREKTA